MCNIFAVCSKEPFSPEKYHSYFQEFSKTAEENKDGWGLGLSDGKDCLLIKEPIPLTTSKIFPQVNTLNNISPKHLLLHIREKSDWSTIHLSNTHPFLYILKKERWLFMHNGNIEPSEQTKIPPTTFLPLGDTDSEKIFCSLLPLLGKNKSLKIIQNHLLQLSKLGSVNIIATNGQKFLVFRGDTERTLFYHQAPQEIIFSKYKIVHDSWQEILPGTLMQVEDGKIFRGAVSK